MHEIRTRDGQILLYCSSVVNGLLDRLIAYVTPMDAKFCLATTMFTTILKPCASCVPDDRMTLPEP